MTRLVKIEVAGEILARAKNGDAHAQSLIYEKVAPAAFALISRIVGVRALAEDLFQETMFTLYRRLDGFRGEAPFGAWVRRIAVSKCLSYLRSPWHRLRGDSDVSMEEPAMPGQAAEVLDLERALARLSPTSRAVVWLYAIEGYTHEEIAAAFGRSVSFSKSQLARSYQELHEWFESE